MSDYRKWLSEKVNTATEEWRRLQFADPFLVLHLYYRPSSPGQPGDLRVATEPPPGYLLASEQRLSPAWTVEQVRYRIAELVRPLPILPYEL